MTTTHTLASKLTPTTTTLPPRGRRKAPITVHLLGQEITPGVMDTAGLRGIPLEPLVMYAAQHGIDPAEALAIGINALILDHAKSQAPGLSRQVQERLHIGDAKNARLGAMHLQKMAKFLGREPEDIVSALELVGEK